MCARGSADFLVRPALGAVSYAQFTRDVRRCCGLYHARGLRAGDRVLILTADDHAAIVAFVAAMLDGLVPVMLAAGTAAPRAAGVALATEPRLLIVDAAQSGEEWASGSLAVDPPGRGVFGRLRPARSGFHAALAGQEDEPRIPGSADALAYLLFTSGTTSAPKGAMITHRSLFAHLQTLSRLFGYGPESRIFNGMVLAHADGLVQGPLLALANGCALVRPAPFSVATLDPWLNAVRANRATHFLSVPTIYSFIDRYAAHDDYFDAPELVGLTSVAAKLDGDLWRRIETRFQRPLFNHYGLTETTTSGLYAGPGLGPIGTVGQPVDMEARIVDASGSDVAPESTGDLWLRGENVFAGYWRDAERTAAAFGDGGWLRTGDLARRRAEGAYEIVGRVKTTIVSGGFLIVPEEIDEALRTHPAVAQSATLGMPDADFGEVAVSAVVLDRPVDEMALIEYCRGRLEAMKVPKRIVVVDTIPRGDSGKPVLDALRPLLEPGVAAATGHDTVGDTVLEIASAAFRVPLARLGLSATPADIPAWDSFAHIALVLQAEQRFGVRIATADVAAIRSLGDLAAAIGRHR
jgi:long-chain acyl-CoA synthetase